MRIRLLMKSNRDCFLLNARQQGPAESAISFGERDYSRLQRSRLCRRRIAIGICTELHRLRSNSGQRRIAGYRAAGTDHSAIPLPNHLPDTGKSRSQRGSQPGHPAGARLMPVRRGWGLGGRHPGGKIAYQRQALLRRNLRPDSQGSPPGSLLAGEIQSLRKLDRDLELNPSARSLLAKRLQKIQADLAVIEGKAFLLAGEPEEARASPRPAQALSPAAK